CCRARRHARHLLVRASHSDGARCFQLGVGSRTNPLAPSVRHNSRVRDASYGAARAVTRAVHEHMSLHLELARERGEAPLAQLPDEDVIEELIATAFWASLRREEGNPPKISLAFADVDET